MDLHLSQATILQTTTASVLVLAAVCGPTGMPSAQTLEVDEFYKQLIDAAMTRSRTVILGLAVILIAGLYAYMTIPKEAEPVTAVTHGDSRGATVTTHVETHLDFTLDAILQGALRIYGNDRLQWHAVTRVIGQMRNTGVVLSPAY